VCKISDHPTGEAVIHTGHHHVQQPVLKIKVFSWKVKLPKDFMCINLLKPNGYVMHHQFNIQQLYAVPTLYLCVL